MILDCETDCFINKTNIDLELILHIIVVSVLSILDIQLQGKMRLFQK